MTQENFSNLSARKVLADWEVISIAASSSKVRAHRSREVVETRRSTAEKSDNLSEMCLAKAPTDDLCLKCDLNNKAFSESSLRDFIRKEEQTGEERSESLIKKRAQLTLEIENRLSNKFVISTLLFINFPKQAVLSDSP